MNASKLSRYTRIARRARLGLVAIAGVGLLALLALEASTHGVAQSGALDLLGAAMLILPIVIVCFFSLDAVGCFASWAYDRRGSHRYGFGRAFVETLVAPALVYLEILGAFWVRAR
jgi:hypothetical protein